MAYQKTAKDLAWDRERTKLKSQIADLQKCCREKQTIIDKKNQEILSLEDKIVALEEALSTFTNRQYTADEVIEHIKRTKSLSSMLSIMGKGLF